MINRKHLLDRPALGLGAAQVLVLSAALLALPRGLAAQEIDSEAIKARFKGLDVNQDATLSGNELDAGELASRDLDGDGRVTGPEFVASGAMDAAGMGPSDPAASPGGGSGDLSASPSAEAATAAPVGGSQEAELPSGRYICYQHGTLYWGYIDFEDAGTYDPVTGSGGTYVLDPASPLVTFNGGIFERYDWVGIRGERDTGQAEIRLVERADLDAVLAGGSRGQGSGLMVICGRSED